MSYYDTATFRPITLWPNARTRYPRRSAFGSDWTATMDLLDRELHMLGARHLVIEVDLDESKIRRDGRPRSDARMNTPGVILSFDSRHGPLRYACDSFDRYRDNIRALALGLEALRKVERYGIASRGEQYLGYKAIGSGIALGPADDFPDALAAARFLVEYGGDPDATDASALLYDADLAASLYRVAAKALHPDAGGDERLFLLATSARDRLARDRVAA